MVAISSCLLGVKCRYNGTSKNKLELLENIHNEPYILICPEILGGFDTPRFSCEIENGFTAKDVIAGNAHIYDTENNDITAQMLLGAEIALKKCIENNIHTVYLQSKSPTCGYGKIYDGTFSGKLIDGNGIFAEMAEQANIKVVSIDGKD